jgi:hypothetical protein
LILFQSTPTHQEVSCRFRMLYASVNESFIPYPASNRFRANPIRLLPDCITAKPIGPAPEQCARNHLVVVGAFNPTFMPDAEIAPVSPGWGQAMDDPTGKFALVRLRADQVRVHHKRTKHEYVFHVAGSHLDVGACVLHPNPAALSDPRGYREEAEGGLRSGSLRTVGQRLRRYRMPLRSTGGWRPRVELVWMGLRAQPMPPPSTATESDAAHVRGQPRPRPRPALARPPNRRLSVFWRSVLQWASLARRSDKLC